MVRFVNLTAKWICLLKIQCWWGKMYCQICQDTYSQWTKQRGDLFDTPMGTALQGPAHLLLSACSAGSRQELQPWACVCHSIMRVGTDRQPPLIKLSLQSGFSTAPKSISLIFSSAYFSCRVPWRVTWNGREHMVLDTTCQRKICLPSAPSIPPPLL